MGKLGILGLEEPLGGQSQGVRAMFVLWVVLIAAGIVFFSIVGLSHR
jgi:hypothetical protein